MISDQVGQVNSSRIIENISNAIIFLLCDVINFSQKYFYRFGMWGKKWNSQEFVDEIVVNEKDSFLRSWKTGFVVIHS